MDIQAALLIAYLAIGVVISEIGFRRRGTLRDAGHAYAALVYVIATTLWLPILVLMALFMRSSNDGEAPQDRPEGRQPEGPPRG